MKQHLTKLHYPLLRQIIRFRIALERTTLKPKLNQRLKLWKGLGSPVIDVSVKNNSWLVYVLTFFGFLARLGYERSGFDTAL